MKRQVQEMRMLLQKSFHPICVLLKAAQPLLCFIIDCLFFFSHRRKLRFFCLFNGKLEYTGHYFPSHFFVFFSKVLQKKVRHTVVWRLICCSRGGPINLSIYFSLSVPMKILTLILIPGVFTMGSNDFWWSSSFFFFVTNINHY